MRPTWWKTASSLPRNAAISQASKPVPVTRSVDCARRARGAELVQESFGC